MTGTPRPVEADGLLWAAAMLMLRCGVHHLPVTEGSRVVGMLSIRGALAVMEHDRIVEPHDVDTVDGPSWQVDPVLWAVRPYGVVGIGRMLTRRRSKETAVGTVDSRTWMEYMSEAECWKLLAGAQVGRLGVLVDSAPEIYPVNHMVDDYTIVFRTDPGTKLAGLAKSPAVCFQIDGIDPEGHRGWSVLVKGRAAELTDPDERHRATERNLRYWSVGPKPHWIRIEPREVTGRRIYRNTDDIAGRDVAGPADAEPRSGPEWTAGQP